MGCLFSSEDVNTRKYAYGGDAAIGTTQSQHSREAAEAASLVHGTDAFSTWVEIQVSAKNLRSADTFS